MRLLIVEDDPDGREMLVELFRAHHWDVTAVPTTQAAMAELRGGGFEVVITDEDLDGHSGSGMLRDAADEGLLQNVGALMYTADPGRLSVPPGVRVLCKPLGIMKLLDEAKAALPEHADAPHEVPSSHERPRNAPVELVVYITDSPSSHGAAQPLAKLIEDLEGQAPSSSRPSHRAPREASLGEAPPSSRAS